MVTELVPIRDQFGYHQMVSYKMKNPVNHKITGFLGLFEMQ